MTTVASSGGVDNGRQFESAMSMIDDSQLVEQLVRSDAVSKKDLRRAHDLAKKRGKGLYETLIAAELVDERTLVKSVGKMLNVRPVWLGERTPDAEVTDRVPRSLAVRNNVLPLKFESGGDSERLVLAMADPLDVLAMDEIASHTGVDVRPVLAGLGDLARALERVYGAAELDDARNASSLDALEQAASGGDDAGGAGLATNSSSVVELTEADLDDGVDGDGLNDDSWAAFFDEAEDVDYTEDSAVISRDMKDRAISSILDAVDSESDPESDQKSDEEDSLKSLDEPLSKSQITGGIEPDLGAWEVDGALDGEQSKDYAKIGHLFVYSPEKAAAHSSEAEVVEEDGEGDGEESAEKKSKSEKEKEPARIEDDRPDESKTSVEESSNEKPKQKSEGAGVGNEPSAAIINPLKKLKKTKPADDQAEQPALDDDSEGEDEPDDKTSIGGGFFGADDQVEESQPSSSPSLKLSEESESEVDDDDDDDTSSSNTAFGFGPASLLADESESEPETSEPEVVEAAPGVESEPAESEPAESEPAESEPAESEPAESEPAESESLAGASLQQTFVARLAELTDLDKESLALIEDASADDLIYAVVLALTQADVLDARDLVEYLGKR